MINRKNKPLLLIAFAVSAGISGLKGQTSAGDIKTTGQCSPVVIQPKSGFQIICRDSTLTRAEALKQAKQVSQLLSTLRGRSQDSSEMIKKLDKILQELNDINPAGSEANSKLALAAAPIYAIPVVDGRATPDLSHGLTQRVVLHTDIVLAAPRLPRMGKDEVIVWTLFVDEDGSGLHQYTTEFLEGKTTWAGLAGNTRISFELVTEANGSTVMRAIPIGNTLKPEASQKK